MFEWTPSLRSRTAERARGRQRRYSPLVLAVCLALTSLAAASCDRAAARTHAIGVVNYNSALSPVYEGFKTKMAALGYVEGQTVAYVYHGLLKPDPQVLEREV